MVNIIFETHGTTFDNENHISSGWNDAKLSPKGEENARDLGKRYNNEEFDVIFCSDLERSYKTAEIAFGDKYKIIKDPRLRECNYGDFTQHSASEVEAEKAKRVDTPFPNGESYEQTSGRMREFLESLIKMYDGKKVMIIGHRATQYGLEYWINGKSIKAQIAIPFVWQPGWRYEFSGF